MSQKIMDMFLLAYGKIRRFYYHKFRRDYIKASHKTRHGECARCGTCCKLLFKCAFLDESEFPFKCKIHKLRPLNCDIFPVDRDDIRDRDIVDRTKACGYRFDK